jgi:hypothetical protein
MHASLFAAAQTFVAGCGGLEELELLHMLCQYAVFIGRNDLVMTALKHALDIAVAGGWLDENTHTWQDLTEEERRRARIVMAELIADHK